MSFALAEGLESRLYLSSQVYDWQSAPIGGGFVTAIVLAH
jgi:hypothetical protein